jgi:MYXO-CTERM domain-containing protein
MKTILLPLLLLVGACGSDARTVVEVENRVTSGGDDSGDGAAMDTGDTGMDTGDSGSGGASGCSCAAVPAVGTAGVSWMLLAMGWMVRRRD